jgi:pyridoxal phosphate enzyme (YggS family)
VSAPPPVGDAGAVAEGLAEVRSRIANAGGDEARITLVAVTKGFGIETVMAARACGLSDVGENYAKELTAKAAALSADTTEGLRWHFLGPVQRNKVASLAPHVELWHGLDRLAAGVAIAARSAKARVLVQVNLTGDPHRPGCRLEDARALAEALDALGLSVLGLMAVGPPGPAEAARPGFRSLARLAGQIGVHELSMGMTDDLEVAVQEGATIVRIGRGLFGPRPGRQAVPG